MDLDEIVDELYGLPPEDFTAARNTAAKQAKTDGDAELSDKVKTLAKPTVAAWLANRLARENADELETLAMLGEQMREATASMDGAKLRELTPRRHSEVDALVKAATKLAGRKISADVGQKLRETLDAALVDPAAAQAVRSGQLTSALRHVGFGVVDESGEPSNVFQLAPRRSAKKTAKTAKPAKTAEKAAPEPKVDKLAIKAAEQAVGEAEAELDAAEARVDDLKSALTDLTDRISQAQDDIQRLTAELEQAKETVEQSRKDRKRVESDLRTAEREARVADRRSQSAAQTLADLR